MDFWPTPAAAVRPLLAHLRPGTRFVEPCAGDGQLIDELVAHGHRCTYAFDIEPRRRDIHLGDARIEVSAGYGASCFITNPPWTRAALHPIIKNLAARRPTWLLFDAPWLHTRQAAAFAPMLRKVVSVGRVKWIEGSKHQGRKDCAWYLFDARGSGPVEFVLREVSAGGHPADGHPGGIRATSRAPKRDCHAVAPGLQG